MVGLVGEEHWTLMRLVASKMGDAASHLGQINMRDRQARVRRAIVGAAVAAMLSLKLCGATWWLLLHVPLGWLYVAYWVIYQSGWVR